MSAADDIKRLADEYRQLPYRPTKDALHTAIDALQSERDALLEALTLIASTDPVDAALDPQRAVRVANAAIKASEGKAA
jgi:hypothetical protein